MVTIIHSTEGKVLPIRKDRKAAPKKHFTSVSSKYQTGETGRRPPSAMFEKMCWPANAFERRGGHSASAKERGRPCLQQQSIAATRATAATSSEVGYCRCKTTTQNRASEIESTTTAEENRNRAHNRKMKEKMCLFYVLLLLLLVLPPTVILPPSLTNNNHDYVLHSILYFTVFRSRGAICVVVFFSTIRTKNSFPSSAMKAG